MRTEGLDAFKGEGRMQTRHPWRWLLTGVAVLVLAVALYAVWLLWDTSRQLSAAADDAQVAKDSLLANDSAAAQDALRSFADHSASAESRTSSPVWSVLTKVPKFGDDARGVRTVSRVADQLADNGLDELTLAVGDLDKVLPSDGAIDVPTIRSLQEPVERGNAALIEARQALSQEDPSEYVESLKLRYRDLQTTVEDAAAAMGIADRALTVLPDMLGAQGRRNYLLVFQNNAEIRATGGLPGSVSLLSVDNGRIALTKQKAGAEFGQAPESVLPLTEAERRLYTDDLGRYFLDANLTPDFPRSAALWRARWEQVEGDTIDGVISMDTVTLSYLLRALGPVEVGGVQLSSDNVVSELLSNVYARLPEGAAQDAFFRDVAGAVFPRITNYNGSLQELFRALRQSARERRLLVHDFHDGGQQELAGTAIAGELSRDADDSPEVGVYFTDATLSKMSYYLRYEVNVSATSCVDGLQRLSGRMSLRSVAPSDAKTSLPDYVTGSGLPARLKGDQLVIAYIVGPVGGTVARLEDDQLDFDQTRVDLNGREVRRIFVLLEPGEVNDISWTMQSAPRSPGPSRLGVTPSVEEGTASATIRSACN